MFRKVTRESMFNRIARQVITLMVVFGLLTLTTPLRVPASVPMTTDLSLRSASQVRTEADSYNTALTEISRISAMKVTTLDQLAQANAIVAKNISKLRYNRSKLAAIGLNESTFINAVKTKAGDTKSAEALATALAKDPAAILKISGAQAVADRIRRSLEADVAKIRQIAAQIKQAASDIKAKTNAHHKSATFGKTRTSPSVEHSLISEPQAVVFDHDIPVLVISVAVIAFPVLGLALVTLTGVAPVIALAAADLITRLISNLGTEEGRDEVAACQGETDEKYRRCISAAADLGILKVPDRKSVV